MRLLAPSLQIPEKVTMCLGRASFCVCTQQVCVMSDAAVQVNAGGNGIVKELGNEFVEWME